MTEIDLMRRALQLAELGAGMVSPNPMVGAVLVKNGQIVGEGYHRYDRLKHAEICAIEMAGDATRGATLFCTLEPCCHHGRTPPCADGVIKAGIARVVIAMTDPNPRVNGVGVERLRAAGIEVEIGLCEREALRLNEIYVKAITSSAPFLHVVEFTAGAAASSEWIPSPQFLDEAVKYDAIVIGESLDANRLILEGCLNRPRRRPLVIAGAANRLDQAEVRGIASRFADKIECLSLVLERNRPAENQAPPQQVETRSGTGKDLLRGSEIDLSGALSALRQTGATSVLILQGAIGLIGSSEYHLIDKLTLVMQSNEAGGEPSLESLDVADRACLHDLSVVRSGAGAEVTGYPRDAAATGPS